MISCSVTSSTLDLLFLYSCLKCVRTERLHPNWNCLWKIRTTQFHRRVWQWIFKISAISAQGNRYNSDFMVTSLFDSRASPFVGLLIQHVQNINPILI